MTLCALVNRDNGSVQWSKGGETLSDHRFYATSDGRTHYLTINNLKKSDAGEYECDVGTDKAHFSVQVKGKLRPTVYVLPCHSTFCMLRQHNY